MLAILFYIILYLALYIILNYTFQYFFKNKKINKKSLKKKSFLIILLSSILIFSIMLFIKDIELANRFQHAIGGGFLAMLISYLAFKDSNANLNKLEIFILSVLLVTFLGVLNEIAEFFVQANTNLIFSHSIEDTWLDLTSNMFGIILGSLPILLAKNIKK